MEYITTSISGPKKGIPHRLRAGVVTRTPQVEESAHPYYERYLGFFNNPAAIPSECPKCHSVLTTRMSRTSPGNITSVTLNCMSCRRIYTSAYPKAQ